MVDKNGGAAFPQSHYQRVGEMDQLKQDSGMTLRDYFAAAALQGWMGSCVEGLHPAERGVEKLIARLSYTMADAMLKARES